MALQQRGQPLDIYLVTEALGAAYSWAFTPQNILSGIRESGIYQFNTGIFTEEDFLSIYVTGLPTENPQKILQKFQKVDKSFDFKIYWLKNVWNY